MSAVSPKKPPHSIEAEQSVLGGLMLDNSKWFDLSDRLGVEDFYTHQHQTIFNAIGKLLTQLRPCDFVTLSEYMRLNGTLEEAGGIAYLGSLAADTPGAANIRAYAEIVRERSVLRQMIGAGNEIAELGYRPDGREAAQLVDIAEQVVFKIRERGERAQTGYFEMAPLIQGIEQRLERMRSDPSSLAGLPTGFSKLDELTTGLHAGDLVIIAGRPSMGKTAVALNIAEHVALEQKRPVVVFSMEMSADQLALRVLSSFGRIDQQHLRTGELDETDWSRLASAGGMIREAPLFIDETGALSPLELRARARRVSAKHQLALIVIDYIQLMQVPSSKDNRTNEISEISRSLKALAKELKVPVIAISQLSRAVEQRDNKHPRMADLRESGGIEQDADVVIFVYRDEYYNPESPSRGTAELIVAKQRNGPTGTVKVAYADRFTRFDNLAHPIYQ